MLDFRFHTFLEVCHFMNFTKAAKSLSITQPAVSQHIHWIEEQYGISLFHFYGKKMFLTKEGKILKNAVTTVKHDEIYLKEKLGNMQSKKQELKFGVTLTIGEYVMPECLCAYQKRYPQTTVKMAVDNTRTLLQKITQGEIDFAIVEGYFGKNEYDYIIYRQEPYIGVYAPGALLEIPEYLEDIQKEHLIIREKGSGTREILERHLEERNFKLEDFEYITEIGNIHALKKMVEEKMGITFLYKIAVKKELEQGVLKELRLKDFQAEHEFAFIWRKGSTFSEQYKRVFQELLMEKEIIQS